MAGTQELGLDRDTARKYIRLEVAAKAATPTAGSEGDLAKTAVEAARANVSLCEATFDQKTETFLRCLENAYRHFGGVPVTTAPDTYEFGNHHSIEPQRDDAAR